MKKQLRKLSILAYALLMGIASYANSEVVVGGNAFTAILGKDGKVYTAGLNTSGQLGRQFIYGTKTSVLAPVENLQNITAISAGWSHALALDCKGHVWAWGSGSSGELGNGINSEGYSTRPDGSSDADRREPFQVLAGVTNMKNPLAQLEGITAITASNARSYAITQDQKLIAWGSNKSYESSSFLGSLGSNGTGWNTNGSPTLSTQPKAETSLPVYVINAETRLALEKVIAVDSKSSFGYALVDDDNDGDPTTGRVYAWGEDYGAINTVIAGAISQTSATSAVLVVDKDLKPLTGISKIAAGEVAGFFVQKSTGNMYSVGAEFLGQRGYGQLTFDKRYAELVVSGDADYNNPFSTLENVVDIAAGQVHTLATVKLGKTDYLMSWGGVENFSVNGTQTRGHLGQNNIGTVTYLASPKFVKYQNGDTVKNVLSVSASAGGSYVTILDPVTLEQKILYFGDNSVGQAALGTQTSEDGTPRYLYPTELPFIEGFAEARPVADLGSRILTLCPNEIPNTGKILFAGSIGSDYTYTWDVDVERKTLSDEDIAKQITSTSSDAYLNVFAAGKYKVSIQQKQNPNFDKKDCPVNQPVMDSIVVEFCKQDFTLSSATISKEESQIVFSGIDNEVYALFDKSKGGKMLAKDTVEAGVGRFDFLASALPKVTSDLNGTPYPTTDHYVRAYSENISVHNLEILPAPTFYSSENMQPQPEFLQNLVVYGDSALLKSVKVKISGYYSSSQINSFVPVICAETINSQGEKVGDKTKILYTGAVACTVSANGEMTVPVNIMLKKTGSEPQSYWLGFKIVGQSYVKVETIKFPGLPQTDAQYPSVKFEAYSKFGILERPIATASYGFAYDFQLSTYGSNPCGRMPIDFKLERPATTGVPATPIFNFNGKSICTTDTAETKPSALNVAGGTFLYHHVYYFKGYIDIDSLKNAGISGAYTEFLNIKHIDSLPKLRVPYDDADKFTMVVVDALHPNATEAWTYQNFYYKRHPRTELSVSPAPSYDLCPTNTDSISLTLKGTAPFTLNYLYSGKTNTLTTSDNTLKFPIGTEPGKYDFKLLSMSDANCSAFTVENIPAKTAGGADTVLRDTIQRSYTVSSYPAMKIAAQFEARIGTATPINLADYYAPVQAIGSSTYISIVDGKVIAGGMWDISDNTMKEGEHCILFDYLEPGQCAYAETFCMNLLPAYRYDLALTVTDGTAPLANVTVTLNNEKYTTDATGKIFVADVLPATFDFHIEQDGYQVATGSYTVVDADLEKTVALDKIIYQAQLVITDGTAPIAGATVNIDGTDYTSDANGKVTVPTISYGTYPVTVNAQGYKPLATTLVAKGTEPALLFPITLREQRVEVINPIAETACGSLLFNGMLISQSGEYRDTIVTPANKDSIVILTATIWPVYELSQDIELPFGSTYSFGGKTLVETGKYDHTFSSIHGCDSTMVINLTILPKVEHKKDSVAEACGSFIFAGETLRESGKYTDTLTATDGNDSIISLTLTIWPEYFDTTRATIKYGETYLDGTVVRSEAGTFTRKMTSIHGCDSVEVLVLTIEPKPVVTVNVADTVCGSKLFGGVLRETSGEYRDTVAGQLADTVTVLNLTVGQTVTNAITASIAAGEIYAFGTILLDASGEYTHTFATRYGCDSIVTLTLTVSKGDAIVNEFTATSCKTTTYGTITATATGEYRDTLLAKSGVDSIVIVHFTRIPIVGDVVNVKINEGDVLSFGNQSITNAGQYESLFIATDGCDSITKIDVSVKPRALIITKDVTACESYEFYGETFTSDGKYTHEIVADERDTLIELNLTIDHPTSTVRYYTIRPGQFVVNGNDTISQAISDLIKFTSLIGCDHVSGIVVTVVEPTTADTAVVRAGEAYSITVSENIAPGRTIAFLPYTDENGAVQTFTLSNTDVFEIIDGAIIIKDSSAIDYELNDTISLTIQITTATGVETATLHLVITNVNDNSPVFAVSTIASQLTSEQNNGDLVVAFTASDADGDALTYRIIDVVANTAALKSLKSTNGIFAIDATSGHVSIADISLIDFASTASYTLTVEVSDGINTDTLVQTITLKNMSVGANAQSALQLTIYPTVATNCVRIEAAVCGSLSMSSLGGYDPILTVDFCHAVDLDVTTLPAGRYFIKIVTESTSLEGTFFRQ